MPHIYYLNLCPRCRGGILSDRLEKGLVCKKCLKDIPPNWEKILNEPTDETKLNNRLKICRLKPNIVSECKDYYEALKFDEFFTKILKNNAWGVQRTWAIRFFNGFSFAMIAPTGVGKTTFGLTLALYLAYFKHQKTYIMLPTTALVSQTYKRLQELSFNIRKEYKDLAGEPKILPYSTELFTTSQLKNIKKQIFSGDFDILITTTMFFYKNISNIPKGICSLVFIDDVDSILKSARRIDAVFRLLGFKQNDIDTALRLILAKRKKNVHLVEKLKIRVDKIKQKRKGQLIVSSATSNPRSFRVRLFRELLDFDVSSPTLNLRNVIDVYEELSDTDDEILFKRALSLIKTLGKGGLVFFPSTQPREKLERFITFLEKHNIKASDYDDLSRKLDSFRNGKLDVLVGFASYRNPLARGIDLPATVRYAIFMGVPQLEMKLEYTTNPLHLYIAWVHLLEWFKKKVQDQEEILQISQKLSTLRKIAYKEIAPDSDEAKEVIRFFIEKLQDILNDKELVDEINHLSDVLIKVDDQDLTFVTADVTGYIQASGRTSRLYAGGLTTGLAYLLVDNKKAFYSLTKKLRWFIDDIEFRSSQEVNLQSIIRKIDQERTLISKMLKGETVSKNFDFKTTLVVVESPNKARTIANFFGTPSKRYINNSVIYEVSYLDRLFLITASLGHIVDLNKEVGLYGVYVKDSKQFIPVFEPIDDSRQELINTLRLLSLEVDEIFIATDPDTEGEKIAYDLMALIKPYNATIKRAEFHEVTKRAFIEAFSNPRDIDINLVKAQLFRRIADRWIGFSLSKYLQNVLNSPTLSAGRVQTPVLDWILERTKESRKKLPVMEFKIKHPTKGFEYTIQFPVDKEVTKQPMIDELKETLYKLKTLHLKEVKRTLHTLVMTPYSTDQLLRDSAYYLNFSPQYTMKLAQDLFEGGFITYHRTDSIRVSDYGIKIAKEYINSEFGEKFFDPKTFKKSHGAHECIRPTRPLDTNKLRQRLLLVNSSLTEDHLKLYDLIFKRFIASQMRPAVLEDVTFKVEFNIKSTPLPHEFTVPAKIKEKGNLMVWDRFKIVPLTVGDYEIISSRLYKKPKVFPYTYSEIISDMKERKIGRPSTYAITVQKLLERGYIVEKKRFIYSTLLGEQVINLLRANKDYWYFVNEKYTRILEEIMDKIQTKEVEYTKQLKVLYKDIVEKILKNTRNVKDPKEIEKF